MLALDAAGRVLSRSKAKPRHKSIIRWPTAAGWKRWRWMRPDAC